MENRKSTQTKRPVFSRTVGVAVNAQTYKNLLYLLARFPLGIAYFVVFVTGLSLGMATIPLLAGVPILAGVLAVAGYVGVVEASLLRIFLGHNVTWSPVNPHETPLVPYLKQVATDPKNYLLLILALASFITGNILFVTLVVGFTLSLSLVAAPAVYWMNDVQYLNVNGSVDLGFITVTGSQFAITTLPEALLISLLGVILSVVGLHVVNLTARVYGGVIASLLCGSR